MCGIAGGFWAEPDVLTDARMEHALHVMRERGPDNRGFKKHAVGAGVALLGHARLSIIDLSVSASQPMYTADGRYGLVFNGEIYNYVELRAELERLGKIFRTQSDTEVLLAAWETWGAGAISRCEGMFAFAVFDFHRHTCTLVRDAFGIKPLFYAVEGRTFYFASDLRALRALKRGRADLNWQRGYDYLVHGEYDFGEATFLEGFLSLRPGHLLEFDLGSANMRRPISWWSPNIAPAATMPFEDASSCLRDMLLQSVRLNLRSDVPLGAALSGGIDSSAIVCAMRHLEPDAPIHTFSFIASDSPVSEEKWVDCVNRHVRAVPHKVAVTATELAADLEDLIDTQGEPFGSTSIYAQYRVFKLAREQGITVTLDGQGADEMLGGYNGFPGQRFRSLIEQGRHRDAALFLRSWSRWPGRRALEGLKRVVGAYSTGWLHHALRNINGMDSEPEWIRSGPLRDAGVMLAYPVQHAPQKMPGRRMMGDLATALTERGLPGLLRHGDRNSMRFSVESRVPFLTPELADFALSLPEEYLVSLQGETKHVLRSAMRGIVPDEILDRKDKIGFATPEQTWLLGMTDTVRRWLKEDLHLPFLDQEKICEHFDQIVAGRRLFSWQVWRWINFCQWYKGLA